MVIESPSLAKPRPAITAAIWWRRFAIAYLCSLLMIAIIGLVLGFGIRTHVQRPLRDEITRNLTQKARLVANRINVDRAHGIEVIASLEGQAAGARATIIDTNSQVIADSEVPIASLQNEGRRPEFVTALRGSTGIELRNRNGAEVLFVAVPVAGGAVRLAYPMSDVAALTGKVSDGLVWSCILAALAALVLCAVVARFVPIR